jgi:hypothetical protein
VPPAAEPDLGQGAMRTALNILHRWLGLVIAGFLFVSGLRACLKLNG